MENKYIAKYRVVAYNIQFLRKNKGLTQEDLAFEIGISKSYLSKIEAPNCYKSFSLEILFDIAEALETPIESLFLAPKGDALL